MLAYVSHNFRTFFGLGAPRDEKLLKFYTPNKINNNVRLFLAKEKKGSLDGFVSSKNTKRLLEKKKKKKFILHTAPLYDYIYVFISFFLVTLDSFKRFYFSKSCALKFETSEEISF